MSRLVALFLLSAAIACEMSTAPIPPDAVQFNPPSVYARWWTLTEQCSGLTGDLSAVHWYVVPNAGSLRLRDGTEVNGFFMANGNSIVIDGPDVLAGDLIR